jgi:hypothetical protein
MIYIAHWKIVSAKAHATVAKRYLAEVVLSWVRQQKSKSVRDWEATKV